MKQIEITALDQYDRIYHTFIRDMLYSLSFSFTVEDCYGSTISCFLTREYHRFCDALDCDPVLIIDYRSKASVIRGIGSLDRDGLIRQRVFEKTGDLVVSNAVAEALCEINERYPMVFDFCSKRIEI